MVLAWHFLAENGKLRDGRDAPPDGVWLEHDGPVMCSSGLHASRHVADALIYAPGPVVCRVEVEGDILRESDKLVGRRRKILWRANATQALRDHARYCARSVLHLWDAPQVVRDYLASGDEEIRDAARAAARDAAWAAARDARDAARAAARDAAWAAAWDARDAAWAAAWAAARDARDAARDAQRRDLSRRIRALAKEGR